MSDFSRYVIAIIEWGLVPLILLGVLIYAIQLQPLNKQLSSSTAAGKVAGFLFFVLFVLSQKGHSLSVSFSLPNYGVQYLPLLISFAVFFALAATLNALLKTRIIGILALLLISCSLIMVYTYLFLPQYRPATVFVVIGGALGGLIETLLLERDPISEESNSARSRSR